MVVKMILLTMMVVFGNDNGCNVAYDDVGLW